jgi:hypothetical protein
MYGDVSNYFVWRTYLPTPTEIGPMSLPQNYGCGHP